jgi:hypothetical protein
MHNSILFNCCPDNAAPDWSQFTALEICPCEVETLADGSTITHGDCAAADATMFCVFGCSPVDGLHDLTDCETLELAEQVAAELSRISGLPIR